MNVTMIIVEVNIPTVLTSTFVFVEENLPIGTNFFNLTYTDLNLGDICTLPKHVLWTLDSEYSRCLPRTSRCVVVCCLLCVCMHWGYHSHVFAHRWKRGLHRSRLLGVTSR